MKVALASCRDLPDWEVDDQPLREELARHVHLEEHPWDAPVDWSAFDAVLIRTTWDYSERVEDFVRWAQQVGRVSRLFNPVEVVRWNTDTSSSSSPKMKLPTILMPASWILRIALG